MLKKGNVFGVRYSIGNQAEAETEILRRLGDLSGKYICFSNVHTLITAVENESYKTALNSSAYTFPDGAPVALKLRRNGEAGAERVAGPDFMSGVFKRTSDGRCSHFFYGSSEEVLKELNKKLKSKYPDINIAGMYSPPYRQLSSEEDAEITEMINRSKADIVWIGLGAPRQEMFMYSHKGKINGLMAGVGAGFDYHAGTLKRAPRWMQKASLEWLYRLISEPKRLVKRYFITNTKFIWYCLTRI